MTDLEIRAALTDRTALAATMLGEARGEPLAGWIAVAWTARNRAADPRWPDSVRDVCLQPKQFSCWNGGDANSARTLAFAERLVSELPIDEEDDRRLAQALWVADGVLSGACPDEVGANHYHRFDISASWSRNHTPVARLGDHVFFRL